MSRDLVRNFYKKDNKVVRKPRLKESGSSTVNWRPYPKSRQKEFISVLREKNSIKGVHQENIVEGQWYNVLNYCFAEPNKQYATRMAKLLETDGMMFVRDITVALSLLGEFKDDNVNLDKRSKQERVLAQVIYYLKKINKHIKDGNRLHLIMPNVILAADSNQVFVINARILYSYLDLNIDWNRNPRSAYDTGEPVELFDKLNQDRNINPYVYDLRSKDFNLNDVLGLVADLASTENPKNLKKIPVNQANIRGVYDEFLRLVTQQRTRVATNQELVGMFIRALTDHDHFILKNNEVTILNDVDNTFKRYLVNGRNWYAFFSRFDTNYSAIEIKNITAVGDVLLEETNRRFSGEYWTPTIWANQAVKLLDNYLGKDWKEKYYVWDSAAGSKNLTRDYKFKHLFSSTLFDNELIIGKNYNKANVSFQYDFLNDDPNLSLDTIDQSKLKSCAPDLVNAIKQNKPIVFFTNPPYGTSGNTSGKKSKTNIAKTAVNRQMLMDHMGHASENLYCQYFYRAVRLKERFNLDNVIIAFFSNSQYLTSSNYFKALNTKIFSNFEFVDGFLFNAGEFSDTATSWGISFTLLKSKTKDNNIPKSFTLKINASSPHGIRELGTHTLISVSKQDSLANWVKEINTHTGKKNWKDKVPLVTGALTASQAKPTLFYPNDAIGYAWFKGNNVEYADKETGLFSTNFSKERGTAITPQNFERVIVNFAVRRATQHSWINNKDSYTAPNNDFLEKRSVISDMVVYSIFNNKNLATSLKKFVYSDKEYRIKNQLFWLSKAQMSKLADINRYAEMGFDIDEDKERFVYLWLKKNHQSITNEGNEVLNKAKMVISDTFNQRKILNEDYPELNLMCWDAGWEQIRRLMNKGRKSKFLSEFKNTYATLESKVNNYIYNYHFLKREL